MNWTKHPDGSYRATSADRARSYTIERDRAARLYCPHCNGRPLKTSGKPGYFILADAKRCCERIEHDHARLVPLV